MNSLFETQAPQVRNPGSIPPDVAAAGVEMLSFRLFEEVEPAGRYDQDIPGTATVHARPVTDDLPSEAAQQAAHALDLTTARADGFGAGESEGRRRAAAEAEMDLHASEARGRRRVAEAVEEFAIARQTYFAAVEPEVVKLALAIAARVLHREAQVDGLLLGGAVRVALEKMASRSTVVLRTSVAEVPAWEQSFRALEPSERPQVVGDATLALGACVLDTRMGTVDLGVKAQLEEIEKGFFDLLQHRPAR